MIVAALKSGITLMRTRPEAWPRFSTATRTRAARRSLSCRLPRSPACSPPTHVSSTSTSPRRGSRAAFTPAGFVKHHPRGLVTRQTELALQKQVRYATLVRGHPIRRPEPIGQRNFRPVENGPRCQRNLVPTLGALVAPLLHQFVGPSVPASRANEPIWPTTSRQILLTGLLGGKVALKLAKRLGKRRSGHLFTPPNGGLLKQPDN